MLGNQPRRGWDGLEHMSMEQKLAFGVVVVQAPVMFMVLMMRPEPVGSVFTAQLTTTTTTITTFENDGQAPTGGNRSAFPIIPFPQQAPPLPPSPSVALSIQEYGLSPFFLVPSLLIIIFASVTHQLHEMKLMDNALEYTEESEAQTGVWTFFLWLTSGLAHAAIYLRLMSPVDLFQLIVAILLPLLCLWRMCLPRSARTESPAFHLVGYLVALALVWDAMRARHGTYAVAFSMLACADLLLVMGHTYDQQPNMLTVGNCRLVYTGWLGFLLLMAYSI